MMIRAEKTTKGKDDTRVLLIGLLAAVFILLVLDPILRTVERFQLQDPWVVVGVEALPQDSGDLLVRYTTEAMVPMTGYWSAYIKEYNQTKREFVRGCGGSGRGQYYKKRESKWKLADWIGADCEVPTADFQLCVIYALTTSFGNSTNTDPQCSVTYSGRDFH